MVKPCVKQHASIMIGINQEIRNRIRLTVAAYAYEIMDNPIMSDFEFDELAQKIEPAVATGNDLLDNFFKDEFSASTGMWIRSHPELNKVRDIYERYYK